MRFLLMASSLTLSLVASASQTKPSNYSPAVTECITGFDFINKGIRKYDMNLLAKFHSGSRSPQKGTQFLNSIDNNGAIEYQKTLQFCNKVTSASEDEMAALKKAFNTFKKNVVIHIKVLKKIKNAIQNGNHEQAYFAILKLKKLLQNDSAAVETLGSSIRKAITSK